MEKITINVKQLFGDTVTRQKQTANLLNHHSSNHSRTSGFLRIQKQAVTCSVLRLV